MNRLLLSCFLLCGFLAAGAETIDVTRFRHAGPYPVQVPYLVDSVDTRSQAFDSARLLDTPLALAAADSAGFVAAADLSLRPSSGHALHLLSFALENSRYAQVTLKVEGLTHYRLFVDGRPYDEGASLSLEPATHTVVVKLLAGATDGEAHPRVVVDGGNSSTSSCLSLREDGKRLYTLADVVEGTRLGGVQLSPDGRYLITTRRTVRPDGKTERASQVTELATGRVVARSAQSLRWMPRSNRYYYTTAEDGDAAVGGRRLLSVDPASGAETVLARHLPDGDFRFAPTEDYLLFTLTDEGPRERSEIYQVLQPEDRQPGWRDRTRLARYDLSTGLLQPLTYGYRNAWAADISPDGRHVLLMVSQSRLTARPTTLYSLYRLDVRTLRADTLVASDGFLSGACFSPDGCQVLLAGSPEALSGVALDLPDGQIPSMVETELSLMDLATRRVVPLTRRFSPSVLQYAWSKADGQIYLTAEERDLYSLFRLDPSSGCATRIDLPEEMVTAFSPASSARLMAWYGQSASNSDRLYLLDTRRLRSTLLEDLSAPLLEDVELGQCLPWSFVSSRGDTICGRYYLPPRFDASRRYPLIVNYYGGCSPVSRLLESRYPHHLYAAQGYVVYVVEPSGATGFGQAFSARHVNTAGEGVAQDIIEGTRRFCAEHPWVDPSRIGCIGASYGGFMTQYLQTQTDLFAAAVSHAGISDHTSYWGEGRWGYSYSEVSMAGSYPWTRRDLYIDRSPLFLADRIHTPLLFVHGDADVNVPVGESIQMFTALKLLGRETALVCVSGEDHHILDYDRRRLWQSTIFAWFARWLQGDASWWESMYGGKTL